MWHKMMKEILIIVSILTGSTFFIVDVGTLYKSYPTTAELFLRANESDLLRTPLKGIANERKAYRKPNSVSKNQYEFTFSIEDYDWISDNEVLASATLGIQIKEEQYGTQRIHVAELERYCSQGTSLRYSYVFGENADEFHLTLLFSTVESEPDSAWPASLSIEANSSDSVVGSGGERRRVQSKFGKQSFSSEGAHLSRTYSFLLTDLEDGNIGLSRLDHHPAAERRTMPMPSSLAEQISWWEFEGDMIELLVKTNLSLSDK